MNATRRELASHKHQPAPPSFMQIAAILFGVTVLSSFSGNALAKNAVHKCMQPDGHFEFTDKKCITEETSPYVDTTVAQAEPASAGTKPVDATTSTPAAKNPEPAHALTQHETIVRQPEVNTEGTSTH